MSRHVTGIFLLAIRNGERIPVDIIDLTEEELRAKFTDRDKAIDFLHAVCEWIRKQVPSE